MSIRVAAKQCWGTASITGLTDILSPGRIMAHAIRLAIQLLLVVYLWRALYAHAGITAGLTETMAVSYAVLAVLMLRIHRQDRYAARDMAIQHIRQGTIVYWFLRPLSPQRYSLWRGIGEQAYGLAWASAGGLASAVAGFLGAPASVGAAAAFAATFLLGLSLLYYLALLTDLMCFWTIKNTAVVSILMFAQNLLSGAYAALWYFPGWFQSASRALPFQYTIGIPLSFYVGRLKPADLPSEISVSAAWVIVLALLTRLLWAKAVARVAAQGG